MKTEALWTSQILVVVKFSTLRPRMPQEGGIESLLKFKIRRYYPSMDALANSQSLLHSLQPAHRI
jgi:hypothetical protein